MRNKTANNVFFGATPVEFLSVRKKRALSFLEAGVRPEILEIVLIKGRE
jgi:hypothetical protein